MSRTTNSIAFSPLFRRSITVCLLWGWLIGGAVTAEDPQVENLWPGTPPGPPALVKGDEQDMTKPEDRLIAGKRIVKLGNVSTPQMHVYLPTKEKANGGAVVICPGGGFSILAWDLEGTEVAQWLNSLGFAAVVVKYRVPTRGHDTPGKWQGPVMDAQRAISLTRSRADQWGLDPNRIGAMGFSAGGETAALVAVNKGDRLYEGIDEADQASCAANFAMLIYPGGIAEQNGALKDDYPVDSETPPMFFVHAADDRVTCLSSTALFTALKQAEVPAELHIFASGGHGYGLRPTESAVTQWTRRAEAWLKEMQFSTASDEVLTDAAGPRSGNPADHLPPHIKRLTWLGERPDWRHDGQRFVFVSKIFGEVYEYEMASQRIYSVSDHFLHHGFTRAMYLSNGDILLVGPVETFDRTSKEDRKRARHEIGQMSVLRHPFDQPPVPLKVQCDEGPAVSRRELRIAWTHGDQDQISVADLDYQDGLPKLANIRRVLDKDDFDPPARIIETQNFVPPDDRAITVTGYQLGMTNNTDAFVFDLETKKLTNITNSPDFYDEPEGIFPDGRFTTVEHASSKDRPWPLIDIYKLPLDGSGTLKRLTHFNEWAGWKASQSVISDDGRYMLFQIGKAGDEAGRGYGVFLYDFEQAEKTADAGGKP